MKNSYSKFLKSNFEGITRCCWKRLLDYFIFFKDIFLVFVLTVFFFVYTRVNFHRLLRNAQNNSQASDIVELKKFFV